MRGLPREQHLEHATKPGAGRVAVTRFFERPAVRVFREDYVGHRGSALFSDEELHLTEARGTQTCKHALLAERIRDQRRIAPQRKAGA